MKKFLTVLTLLLLAFSTKVSAQFIVGGNLGFSAQKDTREFGGSKTEDKTTTITVIPRLAYSFGNNWAGLDVGITNAKYAPENEPENIANFITVSPFFRHIQKPTENFGIWIEGQVGATFGKNKYNGEDANEIFSFGAGIRPGVIFFIGSHLSFEASFGRLGYSRTSVTDPNDSDYKDTSEEFGLSLNNNGIGISPLGLISNGFLFGVNWAF